MATNIETINCTITEGTPKGPIGVGETASGQNKFAEFSNKLLECYTGEGNTLKTCLETWKKQISRAEQEKIWTGDTAEKYFGYIVNVYNSFADYFNDSATAFRERLLSTVKTITSADGSSISASINDMGSIPHCETLTVDTTTTGYKTTEQGFDFTLFQFATETAKLISDINEVLNKISNLVSEVATGKDSDYIWEGDAANDFRRALGENLSTQLAKANENINDINECLETVEHNADFADSSVSSSWQGIN